MLRSDPAMFPFYFLFSRPDPAILGTRKCCMLRSDPAMFPLTPPCSPASRLNNSESQPRAESSLKHIPDAQDNNDKLAEMACRTPHKGRG